jgi:glycosyltransferase involved in cell wall biosynthesis
LENFKFQISNLKLNGEKIEFLGFKKGEELEKLVAGARAIIMPSIWMENLPYSLLEAMAAGKIVIVSRIGGMKEIVKDGINGFSFKPGSSDDLASKINNLDKFDLNKIGEAARQSMKTLEEEEYYREIMEVYLSLG